MAIVIPGLHTTWQVRTCASPSTRARHSKQIPIPQSGARGSPVTDGRHEVKPANAMAVAADVPCATRSSTSFTVTSMSSGKRAHPETRRQIWPGRDRGLTAEQVRHQFSSRQRGGDTQSLMPGRQDYVVHTVGRPD